MKKLIFVFFGVVAVVLSQPNRPVRIFYGVSAPSTCQSNDWFLDSSSGRMGICESGHYVFGSSFTMWTDDGTTVTPPTNRNVAIATMVLGPKTIAAGANHLPDAAAGNAGYVTIVTDAASGSDCTVGGGTSAALCRSSGVAWVPLGGGGGGASGKDYVAAKCQAGVAAATFSLPASGAAVAACVTGVDTPATVKGVLQFTDDGATVISAQDHFTLPATLPASIDFSGKWRSAVANAGVNVVWQIQTKCVADGETAGGAWNAAQVITDANKAVANQENDFAQAGLTITGCAGGEELYWYLARDPAHASDTLGATAELISLRFKFN